MLKIFHESHLGTETIKQNAISMLYWPKMAWDIDELIKTCHTCERIACNKAKENLLPHKIPDYPFEQVARRQFLL